MGQGRDRRNVKTRQGGNMRKRRFEISSGSRGSTARAGGGGNQIGACKAQREGAGGVRVPPLGFFFF